MHDYHRYPIGSKEHDAAYEKEFTTDAGIGYPFPNDPQDSYEVDYAYELAFDRYAEAGAPDGGDLETACIRLRAGEAWQDNDLVFCQRDGTPWKPDHMSKRFKRLAALASVPVITLHEGGRHTGNSLMQDAGVDQELRMREVGHADKSVNDRYTHPLEQAHLAAAEQTATLLRKARDARKAS